MINLPNFSKLPKYVWENFVQVLSLVANISHGYCSAYCDFGASNGSSKENT